MKGILQHADVFRKFYLNAPKSTLVAAQTTDNVKNTYGQPTHTSHPYIIREGEITPLVNVGDYQNRRQSLIESIINYSREHKPKVQMHIVVIPSASKKYMSDKIPYVFRQNTDFLYLTGCLEPDSCLVLTTKDDSKQHSSVLFMRDKDTHSEMWDGPRTGPEQAVSYFGVDKALPVSEFQEYMKSLVVSKDNIMWYDFLNPVQKDVHKMFEDHMKDGSRRSWDTPVPFFHKQRLYKSQAEVALMQKSCDIASEAIRKTIQKSKPLINEHQIFANVDYECRINGANYLAYPPVVAGGERANIIHYIDNNQVVNDGELVLMDAGCEYYGYCSDITRTWPVSGKFSPQQKEVYEVVLDVQKQLIESCSNFPSLDKLFSAMTLLLGQKLQAISLIPKSFSGDTLRRRASDFCPHHVSHYLGMDVHDTPTVPRNISIKPGMIITMEPGIYINDRLHVAKEYQGIGIRIEDDILITENGPVVLTKKCPKEIADIEEATRSEVH